MEPEEIPIAARGAYDFTNEEVPIEQSAEESGPLEKRLESKVWKTRSHALEELKGVLSSSEDAPFAAYINSLVKFTSDSHPSAQEKGIEVVAVYVQKCPEMLFGIEEALVKATIEKGVGSAKASIKQQSVDLLLDFFAVHRDQFDSFFAGVSQALANKNLKLQTAAIYSLNSLMNQFSLRLVPFKPFIGTIEKHASASNAALRSEALNFYKECFRWAREAFLPMVEKLKKAQQDELRKAFDEIEPGVPARRLKHEENMVDNTPQQKQGGAPAVVDMFDMTEARDIFAKYGERWVDALLEKEKWTEKKALLEELNGQANYPKLAEKNAIHLVTLAKRLLNDSNVQVSMQAVKLTGLLAKGQRKYFDNYARQLLPMLIQKYKDKKGPVIQETHTAMDNMLFSVSLEQTLDDVKLALEDKTPSVRINICLWLQRAMANSPEDQIQRVASRLVNLLKKNTDESVVEVRNSAFSIISLLLKKCPDVVEPAIRDLNKAKLKKIEEMQDSPAKKPQAKAKVQPPEEEKAPVKREKKPEPKPKAKSNQPAANNKASAPAKADEDVSAAISAEDAENAVACLIPNETLEKLKASMWKEKQTGLQELKEWVIENKDPASENLEAIARFIKSTTKEWKENNFNVNKAAFEAITALAQNCTMTKRGGAMALTSGALDRFSDMKLVETYNVCISALAEVLGPRFVVSIIVKNTSESNKPKVISECLGAIGRMISEYGAHTISLPELVSFCKFNLTQANPVIKKAAQATIVLIYSFVGQPLVSQLGDVKEATMKALEEEFSRTEVVKRTDYKQVKGEEESKNPGGAMDSFPRANIAGQITSTLEKQLADKNWQIRKEALEAVDALLAQNAMRIQATGLDVLFKSLKPRLSDTNKSLARFTCALVGKLAEALNAECTKFSKIIVKPLLSNLADKQSLLRQDALAAIDKWSQEAGAESVINLCGEHLAMENPELRTELINWLLVHKDALSKVDTRPLLPGVLSSLQDRSASIRNAAELLFAEVIELAGFDALQPLLKDIKPAVMNGLRPLFDKYRTESEVEVRQETRAEPKADRKQPQKQLNKSVSHRPRTSTASARNDDSSPKKKGGGGVEIAILTVGNKEKRLDIDTRSRWSVEELRQDYVDRLREQLRNAVSADLHALLFNADFKKQAEAAHHLAAILNSQRGEFIEVLDLVFKWIWVKLQESTNTQLMKAVLELAAAIVQALETANYALQEGEAMLFLPILCEKTGNNNQVFRSMTRGIIHATAKIYPPERVFIIVLQGVNSKNARSKAECLEELSALIQDFGSGVAPPREIRGIAKLVNSGDSAVRQAAVGVIAEVYKFTGDRIWGIVGDISDKAKDMLDQRFRTLAPPQRKPDSKPPTPKAGRNREEVPEIRPAEKVSESKVEAKIEAKPETRTEFRFEPKAEVKPETEVESRVESKPIRNISRPVERSAPLIDTLLVSPDLSANDNLLSEGPLFEDTFSELDKHIDVLMNGDMSSRVDALVAINDLILNKPESQTNELCTKANSLAEALCKVIQSTFDKPSEEIPLRFAKYFLNVVHRICCTKLIIRELNEDSLYNLTEQVLCKLLKEDLDKLGDKGEGDNMLKTLNGAMLRILEHCRPIRILVVLLKLLRRYRESVQVPKMPGLIIKCLLKLTKIMGSVIHNLEVDRLLVAMHEYMASQTGNTTDEMGTKTIKTMLNELVKILGTGIWEPYEAVKSDPRPDGHLERWITMILNSTSSFNATSPPVQSTPEFSNVDPELTRIFKKLGNNTTHDEAIRELSNHIEVHPQADISGYLSSCSTEMYNTVTEELRKLREAKNSNSETASYNFQDFQNRLAMMKQRYGMTSSTPAPLNSTLTDLKAKVNSLMNKKDEPEDKTDFMNDMKTRIQSLNRR